MQTSIKVAICQKAKELGFDLIGVAAAERPESFEYLDRWLDEGNSGPLDYMVQRRDAFADPQNVLPGVKSIVMLGLNYKTIDPNPAKAGEGQISRYAWNKDYHALIRDRLRQLVELHRQLRPDARARGVVDTAPLMERYFGQKAGLGRIGKNNLLINDRLGSWFFLAGLLSTEEIEPDRPLEGSPCGNCRACIDACPTGALNEHSLDTRRCLSCLTIEFDGPIPIELRPKFNSSLFGCDLCQSVCPKNKSTDETMTEDPFLPLKCRNPVDLAWLFNLTPDEWDREFAYSPIARSGRDRLLRNGAILLGNNPTPNGLDLLKNALRETNPVVRSMAIWAMASYGKAGVEAIKAHLLTENDPSVLGEIHNIVR